MNRFVRTGVCTVVVLVVLCMCTRRRQTHLVTIRTSQGLTLIDSAVETNPYTLHENFSVGYYPIYFIGSLNDTLWIGRKRIPEYEASKEDTLRQLNKTAQFPDSTNMRIVVDTALALPFATFYVDGSGKEFSDSTAYYKSVAVLVYNLFNKPIYVTHFSELPNTVRQSKDSRGKWVDVESPIRYFSIAGSQPKFIHPGEVLVAKALLHKGDIKTECRLKLQYDNNILYSNTYFDYIDRDQVRKPLERFWN